MLASVVTIVFGLVFMRVRLGVRPGSRQTFGEIIYDLAQSQIAEQGLPSKAIGLWFPYVATLFLFVWIVNLLGFIPLPLTQRAHARRRGQGADLRDLRGDVVDLGDARARAPHLRLHARGGHPPQRAGALLQELDPGRAEADADPDRPARDPRPVHAPDLAERPSLREHARGAHDDPDLPRSSS